MYTLTFQATGCPNPGPTTMSFWTQGPDDRTFRDMMAYCELTRTNKANEGQRRWCCGSNNVNGYCRIDRCTKQDKFVGGESI